MSSKIKYIFLTLLVFFIYPQHIKASFSFNISSPSATLITSGGQEVDVSINITDLPSESYLRVSLQKEGGGSYFGYIKNNNNEWSKILALNSDCTGYFKVSDLSTTLVNLKYKIGDDIILDNGNYLLKAHKFTKTCNSYSDSTNSISFVVTLPTPTPTISPTNPPTQAPTTAPTASPTAKPSPTKSPTPKPTVSATPTEEPETTDELVQEIKSEITIESDKPIPTGLVAGASTENKSKTVAFIFISLGILLLGYCGYLIYNVKNGKVKESS